MHLPIIAKPYNKVTTKGNAANPTKQETNQYFYHFTHHILLSFKYKDHIIFVHDGDV